ncbi:MAG: SDR family NAD(P)-dependent oxidoreductase [Dyadobacter sp.]|uniref:SDR family NAD(P)-dependent oxidoreductase n=1 Tax=Dyadobacter sp. TaxID=1914288 RepID=UPI0032633704
MAEQLNQTVAIITGASSGIGQATALRLASAGAQVVLVARREDRLKKLEQQIVDAGGRAFSIAADLTSADEAALVITKTIAAFGRLDTLVNAAGVMMNGPSVDSPLSEWDHMVNVNLRGLMYITKAALPHLLAAVATSPRKVADVVNISSVSGRVAAPEVAIYTATKFAVTAATEAWRQEFTKQSLRFSVVEPGATVSELFEAKDGQWEGFTSMFGEVERLHAEDIAEGIAFIVTNPRRVAVNEMLIRPTDQA